jgi:hypothetical protein
MVPVSLAVSLLRWSGALHHIAATLSPVFNYMGLPGEAALAFLSAVFLNMYSAISVMGSLTLGPREVTILALMCLFTHNLIVETAVQRRTGSSAMGMVLIRFTGTLVGALTLNALLPGSFEASAQAVPGAEGSDSLLNVLGNWWPNALRLVVTVVLIVTGLMILQRILTEFGVTRILSRLLRPLLRAMGLPEETALLWVVSNTLGLAYGSAILIDEVESGALSRHNSDLLNHHIAVSHSLLEDTLLFVAVGAYAPWIIFPRLIFATIVVWLRRLASRLTRRPAHRSEHERGP